MDLSTNMKKRRSIRKYKPDAVPFSDVMLCLEAARIAPSWKNTQCWRYVVVSSPEQKSALGAAVNYNPGGADTYANAPYIIVQCADTQGSEFWDEKQYFMMDMGISFDHLILQATALGLGTCWVGAFPEAAVRDVLDIPENIRVTALTPLGYPAEQPAARPRRDMADIAYQDTWGTPLQP